MDLYHVWFDLKAGVRDVDFADELARFLGHLVETERIAGWRLARRKLGFGLPELGEFHVQIEVRDLAQLEGAFQTLGARAGAVEDLHAAVNQRVTGFRAALYRDFPDAFRRRGEERF